MSLPLTTFSSVHFPSKMDFVIQVTFQRNLCGLLLKMHSFKLSTFLVTIGLACRMYFVKERISLTFMIVCPVMSEVRSRNKQQPSCTVKHPALLSELSNVQRQEGGDSCGLFAIAMAYDLCNRQDPFVSTYNESRLRPHLQRCFQQEKISQFPGGNPSKRRKKRILHEDCGCFLHLSIPGH